VDDEELSHGEDAPARVAAPQPACWVCGAAAARDPRYSATALVRCGACGFLFAPVASAGELKELYDAEYFDAYPGGEPYDFDEAQRRFEARRRVAFVRQHVPGGRLLEVGAASGWFLGEAKAAGFDPVGIEPAADVAAGAAQRWDVVVQGTTIEEADLPRGGFDVVVAWHALEHIAAPAGALQRLREALRPGGLLLLEVPNIASVAARRLGPAWFHLDIAHHVGHYAPATLRMLLDRTGFEPVAIDTYPPAAYLRPGRALTPRALAWQAKVLLNVRASPRSSHPWKHELLRAVARVPAT
jgi:SAM-dependent methyltransferase